MQIQVDAANAACSNIIPARLREGTRMAMLAWCLAKLGHHVRLQPNRAMQDSGRRQVFKDLFGLHTKPDVLIVPAETILSRRPLCDIVVGFKTSVNLAADEEFLQKCDVLMAHEYDLAIDDHPKLLPIWFAIFDAMIDLFVSESELDAYMSDDVQHFRLKYAEPKRRWLGFAGKSDYGRRAMAEQMPDWCDWQFNANMSPRQYIRYVMECHAGIFLPGDTPKSYRLSELALLGIPIVTIPLATRVEPPLTPANSVQLAAWYDTDSLADGLNRLEEIAREADKCYLAGWSVMGQARLLTERLSKMV